MSETICLNVVRSDDGLYLVYKDGEQISIHATNDNAVKFVNELISSMKNVKSITPYKDRNAELSLQFNVEIEND